MMKRTKTMVAAGGVALALAGTGAGVAVAQTSPTPAPSTNAAPNGAAPNNNAPKAHAPGVKKHAKGLLGKVEHGEFTAHTKTGDKVLDVQRGTVTAVNDTSITVLSSDKFSATYAVSSTTKVHKGKKAAAGSPIAVNDRVQLVATMSTTADPATAQHIGDDGPAK